MQREKVMERINRTRKGYLDIAKAIGIIIVLINHIELSLGRANEFLGVFFVSEFFLLAGMTFRQKPEETTKSFAIKKAKRLLFPYVLYSLFYLVWYSLRSIAAGQFSGADFWQKLAGCLYARTYVFPARENKIYLMEIMNAPMWFLPALFFSLLCYYILSTYLGEKKKWGILVLFIFAAVIHYTVPILLPWSVDTSLVMLPLLYAGEKLASRDYIKVMQKNFWLTPLLAVTFIFLTLRNGSGNISIGDYGKSMLLYLIISFLGSYLCIMLSFFLEKYLHFLGRMLMIIGENTLDILCLHLFIFAILQTISPILGISSATWLFKLFTIAAGITIPIAIKNAINFFKGAYKKYGCAHHKKER